MCRALVRPRLRRVVARSLCRGWFRPAGPGTAARPRGPRREVMTALLPSTLPCRGWPQRRPHRGVAAAVVGLLLAEERLVVGHLLRHHGRGLGGPAGPLHVHHPRGGLAARGRGPDRGGRWAAGAVRRGRQPRLQSTIHRVPHAPWPGREFALRRRCRRQQIALAASTTQKGPAPFRRRRGAGPWCFAGRWKVPRSLCLFLRSEGGRRFWCGTLRAGPGCLAGSRGR